jgi:hypothetical protein
MSGHTPEPWAWAGDRSDLEEDPQQGRPASKYGAWDLIGVDGSTVCGWQVDHFKREWWSIPSKANAQRIVACVNACEGIKDPAVIKEMVAMLKRLEHCNSRSPGQGHAAEPTCPICNHDTSTLYDIPFHAEDCKLGALLKKLEQ